MRIVTVLRRPSLVRYFESTLALLAERGHDVELVFSELVGKGTEPPDLERAKALLAAHPDRIGYRAAPEIDPSAGFRGIAGVVRMAGDFSRYLHPRYAGAPRLRERLTDRLASLLDPAERGGVGGAAASLVRGLSQRRSARLAAAGAWLGRRLEEALPPSPEIVDSLNELRPDVVIVSPLIDPGSDQVEFVKAARHLGIPSGAAIASWDNLSSKGLIRLDPDRVFVWNETQLQEAEELHGVPRASVVATGAPRFDPWFERKPSRDAAAFASEVGLDPSRPFLLYLCSSAFIAPDEPAFVASWLARVQDDPELGSLGVLVRPHPQNARAWTGIKLPGNATVWPRDGANVDDERTRADFYDSLAHCTAVVGANTSALIEAAIVGKSVYSVTDGSFGETLHYEYLRAANGGFLHEASDLDEHVAQLRAHLHDPSSDTERTRRFVESFVRPRGLAIPATEVLADEIERVATLRAAPLPRPPATRLLQLFVGLGAGIRRRRARESWANGDSDTVRA
jgi:hypothetical protein